MAHHITIRIDDKLWPYIKNQPNKSRYIRGLIKDQVYAERDLPIANRVKELLMADEAFWLELTERNTNSAIRPSYIQSTPTKEPFIPRPPDPATGYPCCTRPSPCKHWQWDDVAQHNVNLLTGAVREP